MCPPEESGIQLTPFNGPVSPFLKPWEPTAPDYLEEYFRDLRSMKHKPRVGIRAYIRLIALLAGLLVHDQLKTSRRRGTRTECVPRSGLISTHDQQLDERASTLPMPDDARGGATHPIEFNFWHLDRDSSARLGSAGCLLALALR